MNWKEPNPTLCAAFSWLDFSTIFLISMLNYSITTRLTSRLLPHVRRLHLLFSPRYWLCPSPVRSTNRPWSWSLGRLAGYPFHRRLVSRDLSWYWSGQYLPVCHQSRRLWGLSIQQPFRLVYPRPTASDLGQDDPICRAVDTWKRENIVQGKGKACH